MIGRPLIHISTDRSHKNKEACKFIPYLGQPPNFDHAVEDAAFKVLGGSSKLVIADLGEPSKLTQAWSEGRWPLYSKLHGDYHSDKLKNTAVELQRQDEEMRRGLVDACRSKGLAVVGYSGRDFSIMAALTDAIDNGRGYPGGLFWFKRSGEIPYPAATELIVEAQRTGIDAHFIEVETFDELLSDIVRFLPETERAAQSIRDAERPRLAKAPLRSARTSTPAVRTNALPVTFFPAACRLVTCEIGGWKDIQAAIKTSGADILAQRCRQGVLSFGRDADVKRTFEPYKITSFDTYAIRQDRLLRQSGERNLVSDALFRAVGQRPGLRCERRGINVLLFPDPRVVTSSDFDTNGTKAVTSINGKLRLGVSWTEACGLRIDYRLGRLWLLLHPLVKRVIPEGASEEAIEESREFVRERQASRRNIAANAMIDGWARLITGDSRSLRLRTFNVSDGYDGEFEIMRVSGFSGKL